MVKEVNKLIVFEDKKIRRTIYNDEWYYSVVDMVAVLTESPTPRQYWGKLKEREFIQLEVSPIWVQLKLYAEDGKMRETDCINTKNAFRLIQSIPSKKVEPFKQWLAELGQERIDEIENPELAQDRVKEYYELKGYPKSWIDKRLRGIAVRQELTNEWKKRDVGSEKEYAILTNEISKATFEIGVNEYKELKGLVKKNENLRDHMTDLELIFTMLGEASTTQITTSKNVKGFNECKTAANEGGSIAKNARLELEKKSGEKIISNKNYLNLKKKLK